jgi:hypothetical protein
VAKDERIVPSAGIYAVKQESGGESANYANGTVSHDSMPSVHENGIPPVNGRAVIS